MSKAFTRESEEDDAPEQRPPLEPWPAGVKYYVTPMGHAALRAALEQLRAGGHANDARVAALIQRLEAAEVIDPTTQPHDRVLFGATVTVEDEDGGERRWRIVGTEEAEPARGWVSWRSPVARVLINLRVGESATLRTRAGVQELTVKKIEYEA
jgi:transcription elongation factor GreB